MAFKIDEKLDEEKKPGEEETASQGQVLSSPGAGSSSTGQSAAGTAAKDKTSSGSFTNLQAYVGANTGADTAMVNRVGNTVNNAVTVATGTGNALEDKATNLVSEGTVTDDIGVTKALTEVKNPGLAPTAPLRSVPTATPITPTTKPASQNGGRGGNGGYQPPTVAPDAPTVNGRDPQTGVVPAKTIHDFTVADIDPLWNAEYSGPKSWDDDKLAAEAEAARQAYGKVATYGKQAGGDIIDRGELLNDTFARSGQQYGKGERLLDSFILGTGGEAGTLQGIADTANNHGVEFEDIKRWIGAKDIDGSLVSEGIKTTNKTKSDVREAGLGAEGRIEDEFTALTAKGGTLEQKIKTEEAIITAAINKDPKALKQFGLSPDEIAILIAEKDLTPEKVKNFLTGSVNYKLGDVAAESDVDNYGQLMKLLTGADKEGTIKQDFTDFGKGTGTKLTVKDGVKEALAGLADIQAKEAIIKKTNDEKQAKQDRITTILSKFNSSYSQGPTPEEMAEVAALLNINVEALQNMSDNMGNLWEAEDIDALITKSPHLTLGNVTNSTEESEFQKILAFLGTTKDFAAADENVETTIDTSGDLFEQKEFQDNMTQIVYAALVEPTGDNYRKAYGAFSADWSTEDRTIFPAHVFTPLLATLQMSAIDAAQGIMSMVKLLELTGEEARLYVEREVEKAMQTPPKTLEQLQAENRPPPGKKSGKSPVQKALTDPGELL